MKKIISKIMFMLVVVCVSACIFTSVQANTIKSIMIDVLVNPDGSASVTEVWDASLTKGTEGYKTLGNLSGYEILNFRVSDETNREYKLLSKWNVNSSFSQKAYSCGINKSGGQLELCWGISEYGNKTYTLKYDIKGFVKEYTDSQGIYFSFVAEEMDQRVSKAKVVIHSNEIDFNKDIAQIWAFGYPNGTIEFENGAIVMDSKGSISSTEYMTALVKINEKVFDTNHTVKYAFDKEYEDAMVGTKTSSSANKGITTHPVFMVFYVIGSIIATLATFALNPAMWLVIIILISAKNREKLIGNRVNITSSDRKLPTDKEVNYFREIPCSGKITRAFWLSDRYTVTDRSADIRAGLVGAYLLKLIRENRVQICKTKAGLFSFKDNNYAIDLTWLQHGEDEVENDLIDMLIAAAGTNKILESKEFTKYCKSNYTKIDSFFRKVDRTEVESLVTDGFIQENKEIHKNIFGKEREYTVRKPLPQLREEAIKLKGLKKFLLDFSLIKQREAIEVHLWDEYLIFANVLGIADKVEEQFSKLYPDFKLCENSEFSTSDIYRCTAHFSSAGIKAATRASGSSGTSSGGGGHSHSGGGHSSGGHSHGGGFR